MNIGIYGLGYVGSVSAGCLVSQGHCVVGVDPNATKVDLVRRGLSPIIEKDIGDLIADGVRRGSLFATESVADAVHASDISIVCVGTPSQLNGNLDLSYVRRVCEQIGSALRDKGSYHVVVIRSTMLPGSMRGVVIPTLEEHSGLVAGAEFGVCNHPEFLREGSAVFDYFHPPMTIFGEIDTKAGSMLARLYAEVDAPLIRASLEVAEMVKYADNNWHALKVSFANEIGSICKEVGIDGQAVMKIFCQDTKLNLSEYYLRPGFAFGGSCLPKDVRALTYKARSLDLDLPLLNAILPSNRRQIERATEMIIRKGNRRVGILGFAFKSGTDDLRESPMVEVIEHLIGKGFDLRIYDEYVNLAALTGANRDYILNHIPHISRLMVQSVNEVLEFGSTIVIGNRSPEFTQAVEALRDEQVLIDFVRVREEQSGSRYDGICW